MKRDVFLLILITFLVYLNSFGNAFVWDDLNNIAQNKTLNGPPGLREIFLNPTAQIFYRPIPYLTIWLDWLFWDESSGGFFFTADDAEKLLVRPKEIYDGAIPSGNSIVALDLIRLGRLTICLSSNAYCP